MSEQGSDVGAELNRLRLEYFGLRKRVAELEAFVAEAVGTHGDPCDGSRCSFKSRGRALLAPREPIPEPKCESCATVRRNSRVYCGRPDCGEVPHLYGDVTAAAVTDAAISPEQARAIFESGERTEETRVASTRTPSEDGTEPVADTRRSLPEGSTPSLASSGLTPDRIHRMKLARDAFRAAMGKPAPCATCGGSGQVAVMRVEIALDENGDPGGEWVGDSERCPDCRGGGK